jgi:hypothetical protein
MEELLLYCPLYLLHKSEDTNKPKNYWQITYLPTMYETLTGITARRLQHLEEHILLPAQQNGCHSEEKDARIKCWYHK